MNLHLCLKIINMIFFVSTHNTAFINNIQHYITIKKIKIMNNSFFSMEYFFKH